LDYDPTQDEVDTMVRSVIQYTRKLVYKKVGKDQYRVHCNICCADHIVPYKMVEMIRASKVCKWCGENVSTSTKYDDTVTRWLMFGHGYDNNEYGFYMKVESSWGKPVNVEYNHVATWANGQTYVKDILKYMNTLSFDRKPRGWRKVRGKYNSYAYAFDWVRDYEPETLKDRYERFCKNYGITFKSNQKKILIDGVYNESQMAYLYYFDLKSADDIKKYNRYINAHNIGHFVIPRVLNIYYLDYLNRYDMKVYFGDYIDYLNQCDKLHLKPEKLEPEAFRKKHYQLSQQLQDLADAECNRSISSLVEELKERNYEEGNIAIKVFANANQIRETGKQLHNCIGTYIKKYARRETNIFYGEVDGNLEFALEEKNGTVIQVRTDFNRSPTEEIKKVVMNWSKMNGIEYAMRG